MHEDLQKQFKELTDAFGKINVIDPSPDNISRSLELLDKGLNLIKACTSKNEFSRTSGYIHEENPELDILAIGQLFTETRKTLDKENPTPNDKVLLQGAIKRLDTLKVRLDKSVAVYAGLPDISTKRPG